MCSKIYLFTFTVPPIGLPGAEEVANPAHLKQPISVGLCGGTVDHVTLVKLHWVIVFWLGLEGHLSFK